MSAVFTEKINGHDFAHDPPVDEHIPLPVEQLPELKLYGPNNRTLKNPTMPVKSQNVIQVPQWALTLFFLPVIGLGVWFVQFATNMTTITTTNSARLQKLEDNNQHEQDLKFQKMLDEAYRKGQLDGVKMKELTK